MNVVMLASDRAASTYLYQEIARHGISPLLVRPIEQHAGSATRGWAKLKRLPFHSAAAALRGRFFTRHERILERQISRQLFGSPTWPSLEAVVQIPLPVFKSPECVQTFVSLRPDILLVCGAPILRPEVLAIPKIGTINLHFGIAPDYRGLHTLFWAWYLGDWDHIGFTLHCVDKGIDTGTILARGYPALDRHDTEATLWAKCARLAAPIIVEVLQASEKSPLVGVQQSSRGRLFQGRDRKIGNQLHAWWKQRVWRPRIPERPSRVETFFGSKAAKGGGWQ
jgi:methionyl-tRNA formyltransferase